MKLSSDGLTNSINTVVCDPDGNTTGNAATATQIYDKFVSPNANGITWTGDVWYNYCYWTPSTDSDHFKFIISARRTNSVYDNTSTATFRFSKYSFESQNITFTGAHLCLVKKQHYHENMSGLVFSVSNNNVFNIDHSIKTTISEALPILELCDEAKSKKVYGIFNTTDLENNPCKSDLTLSDNLYDEIKMIKTTRSVINAIGEGGIWVCNKEGFLECGDFITSSTVPGYGVLQDDDILHNYTVARILCDCNFSLVKEKKQKIPYGIDISGTKTILYKDDGCPLYEDDLDEQGNITNEYKYETRFLLPDGTILEENEEEYLIRKQAGEEIYIACFVGCIYYCG